MKLCDLPRLPEIILKLKNTSKSPFFFEGLSGLFLYFTYVDLYFIFGLTDNKPA
jgi:hypothetical protein